MIIASVVASPGISLGEVGFPVLHLPRVDAPRAMRWAAAILAVSPQDPLLLALDGDAALEAPALALAQRTAHRSIAAYLLVEPTLPAPHPEWPDAPVTVVTADEGLARQARLRGWEVFDGPVVDAARELLQR